MARARNIKPSFFMNEILGEADPVIGLLFIGLWCLADREGRLEDRPRKIKAELLPYRDGLNVDEMLSFLAHHELIMRYEIEGIKYIQISKFSKHQTPHHLEVPSVIPPPEGEENKLNHTPIGVPQRRRIYERDGYKCVLCGAVDNLSIDHIKPVSKGGDSSDENLRTLCKPCNSSKGNREKASKKHEHKMRSSKAHDGQSGSYPTDSGYLIPDSLIPDSLIPRFTPTPELSTPETKPLPAGSPSGLENLPAVIEPPPPPATLPEDTELQAACKRTWAAYSQAYTKRHGAEPLKNATVRSQIKQFVQRVGQAEAPMIAAFYVGHNSRNYVAKKHAVGLLLANAETLHTEWVTNNPGTQAQATQADRTQANFNAAEEAKLILGRMLSNEP